MVGSGNLAADMYANVMAESTGRVLATRLWEMTDDPGMKDMLSFLIARDSMHQNQWLAVLEDLGGVEAVHPIPHPQSKEHSEVAYSFISTNIDQTDRSSAGRWSEGPSTDGKGNFEFVPTVPSGQEPVLGPPASAAHAQQEQMMNGLGKMVRSIR